MKTFSTHFMTIEAQIVVILFVVFSSDVIISPYPLKMSRKNSASHFTLPRTQPCFPRPLVFFCLGGGISLTASAYRGIRRNAPQRNEILRHSDATKAMRSPQRRARCRATKFLGMCEEGNAQPAAAYAPHSNEIH